MDIVTSRSVVVISTTCGVLYGLLWLVGLLQTNGIIGTGLPFAAADRVILQRSGAQMKSVPPSAGDQAAREKALSQAQTAPNGSAQAAAESPITLDVESAPPVQLWVTDSQQGEIGTNPQTGLVRLQIPGASYSGRDSNPQLISVPHAQGKYRVQLFGTANGKFQLTVRAFLGSDLEHAVKFSGEGDIFEDTLLQATAEVSLNGDGTPALNVTPVQVVTAGKAPVQAAPASPSASASPSDAVVPASGVAGLEGGATVVRPRPLPQPPIPLPPVPALPVQAPANQAPPPAASAPAGGYGSPAPSTNRALLSDADPLQRILNAPRALAQAVGAGTH